MIVADTSAWVEYLRASAHPAAETLRRLIEQDADLAVTEIIVMELLAGAGDGSRSRDLGARLRNFPVLPLNGLGDYEQAASIYRSCQDAGETLRGHADCLVAVPAIRANAAILHNDRDFDTISKHTRLRIHLPTMEK